MGGRKMPEYPWQLPLAPWSPNAKLSEAGRRRLDCAFFFEFEADSIGFGCPSDLVYDADADVFRFADGRFALSREHADWAGLKAMGYFRAWGM